MDIQAPSISPAAPAARLHPLLAVAALSVIIASAVGVAAMTGVLPHGKAIETPLAVAPQPGGIAVPAPLAAAPEPRPAAAQPTQTAQPATTQAAPAPKAAAKPVAVARKAEPTRAPVQAAAREEAKPQERPGMSHAEVLAARERAEAEARAVIARAPVPPGPIAETPAEAQARPVAKPACATCGVIEQVRTVEQKGDGTGLGAAAGGLTGAVLGKNLGKGGGNTIMTILGAAGGAYAGHQLEKQSRAVKRYEIAVRMEDGSTRTLTQEQEPAFRSGDKVRVVDGHLVAEAG